MRDDDFEGNTKRVLLFIRDNPGCHLRRIKNELGISMGTAQYHLDKLEKAGKIISQRHSLRRYYFVVGVFQEREKTLLQLLGNETAREILMFIAEQSNPTQTDLVKQIGISPASVNWHIKRLVTFEVIEEIREGKFKRYKLRGDPKYVIALLRNYYPGVWDRWSNRLAEMFLSMSSQHIEEAEGGKEEQEK